MPPDKALFESRDVSPPGYDADDTEHGKKYMGAERRRENRRSGEERRTEVRFELGKEDRRQNQGRRHGDHTPKFW